MTLSQGAIASMKGSKSTVMSIFTPGRAARRPSMKISSM
jgi:hypothetical protein